MELVRFYNSVAHSDGFEFEPCWLNLKEDRSEVSTFLKKVQENSKTKRVTLMDIWLSLKGGIPDAPVNGSTTKVVIQLINKDVTSQSAISGYWTRLAFLVRLGPGLNENWMLYGIGKGRFKRKHLKIKSDEKRSVLVFSSHFSEKVDLVCEN